MTANGQVDGSAPPPGDVTVSGPDAALVRRVRLVEGQVHGLHRMIETERDPVEIMMLIAQVRGGLQAIGAMVLEEYLVETLDAARRAAEGQPRGLGLERLVRVLRNWMR